MRRGDFPYDLSKHAADVAAERGIALDWIVRTIRSPERTEADALDAALTHALAPVPEFAGRILRVVYNPGVQPWRVVTVYFDRAARRKP